MPTEPSGVSRMNRRNAPAVHAFEEGARVQLRLREKLIGPRHQRASRERLQSSGADELDKRIGLFAKKRRFDLRGASACSGRTPFRDAPGAGTVLLICVRSRAASRSTVRSA